MKKTLLSALCAMVLCCGSTVTVPSYAQSTKPFTIPELRSWKGATGTFRISSASRIVVAPGTKEALQVAAQLAEDYKMMFGTTLTVTTGRASSGDIALVIKKAKQFGTEGYRLQIGKNITMEGATPRALYYATRSLLQLREAGEALPKGETVDVPQYRLRGFLMDCGRKYIPMSYLRSLVKIMGYYKMNTLQVHLNDNGFRQFYGGDWSQTYSAFRLECSTYPGLTARDGSYTKREFIAFQEYADSCGVDIIPEIDAPAHSLAFTQYKPEIGSKEYGMDHLDILNPTTYTFMDALWKEYLEGPNPVFRGRRVDIGTDEYNNSKKEVVEAFRSFTDHYIRLVESYGKQACLWGALTHAKGETPVKSKDVVMGCWYNGYAEPRDMKQQGYQLISIPDGLVYIVPATGYYYDYLNTDYLYTKWSPRFIGKEEFAANDPQLLGGMFAVWNDHAGNGISVKDIHHRVMPAMQTLAAKTWDGDGVTFSYAQFDSLRQTLSEAPGVNELGRIGKPHSTVLTKAEVIPGSTLPYDGIGYDYSVSFHIKAAVEAPGTELFRSTSSVVYLSDPVSGRMAFARDGYLYTFRYAPSEGEEADLRIEGDNKATRLYVNGQLYDNFDIQPTYLGPKKELRNQVRTLFFPLRQAGQFKSRITNLKVDRK